MRERPILFSGPMIRALLDGHKTQTRRVVHQALVADLHGDGANILHRCPYGTVGDRLWVKEAVRRWDWIDGGETSVQYVADGHLHDDAEWVWKRGTLPSMFMTRGLSRLTLTITDVRVERLQEISEGDAEAEGISFMREYPDVDETLTARQLYAALWDSINAKRAPWASNPWVWAITFERAP